MYRIHAHVRPRPLKLGTHLDTVFQGAVQRLRLLVIVVGVAVLSDFSVGGRFAGFREDFIQSWSRRKGQDMRRRGGL